MIDFLKLIAELLNEMVNSVNVLFDSLKEIEYIA
jgi:hypothetical protein